MNISPAYRAFQSFFATAVALSWSALNPAPTKITGYIQKIRKKLHSKAVQVIFNEIDTKFHQLNEKVDFCLSNDLITAASEKKLL